VQGNLPTRGAFNTVERDRIPRLDIVTVCDGEVVSLDGDDDRECVRNDKVNILDFLAVQLRHFGDYIIKVVLGVVIVLLRRPASVVPGCVVDVDVLEEGGQFMEH